MTMEKLAELGWESKREECEDQRQFREDMAKADRKIKFYRGRFYYKGWATNAVDFIALQNIIRETSVVLQWDQLGKRGYVVYPRTYT